MRLSAKIAAALGVTIGTGLVVSLTPLNSVALLTEYGPLEMAQLVVMGIGAVLWLRIGPAEISLNILMASFLLVLIGRETTWTGIFGTSDAVVDRIEMTHLAILLLTLAALCMYWLTPRVRQARLFRTALRSDYTGWLLVGVLVTALGDVFDKELLPISSSLFFEEWFEFCGYVCFCVLPLTRWTERA